VYAKVWRGSGCLCSVLYFKFNVHALTWNNNVGNAFFVVITRFSIDTRKTFFPFLFKLTFHCKKKPNSKLQTLYHNPLKILVLYRLILNIQKVLILQLYNIPHKCRSTMSPDCTVINIISLIKIIIYLYFMICQCCCKVKIYKDCSIRPQELTNKL
jgi:hypothetical protein